MSRLDKFNVKMEAKQLAAITIVCALILFGFTLMLYGTRKPPCSSGCADVCQELLDCFKGCADQGHNDFSIVFDSTKPANVCTCKDAQNIINIKVD